MVPAGPASAQSFPDPGADAARHGVTLAATSAADAGPGSVPVIVRLADGTDPDAAAARFAAAGGTVGAVLHAPFAGVALQAPPAQVDALRRDPNVVAVGPDDLVTTADAPRSPVAAQSTQIGAPWDLDRLDQRALPLSGTFDPGSTGAGVQVYVLDSGVRADHVEFGGRVLPGAWLDDGLGPNDCNGHGTHVAGTIGSSTYGVAKGVSLIPVRVLDCEGTGRESAIIAGLDWIVNVHASGTPAVLNMSIGGQADDWLDAAVQRAIDDGIVVVAAAGNDGTDACAESPARLPAALTVGAADVHDAVPAWSNRGRCLDLFAPGVDVRSTWPTTATATNKLSGTSMASPHVAGAAALLLAQQPTLTPAQVAARLVADATPDVLDATGAGSPNRYLFITAPAAPPVALHRTGYVPLAPARLLDSRPDGTTIDGALQDLGTRDAGTTTEVQITGRDGIPTNTPAATLNITATDTRGPGFLTIYPCGSARPNASNLNYATGTTIANTTIAKLSPTGTICVFTYATTHLIVDVNGYYDPTTTYVPLAPARLLDSRPDGTTIDGALQDLGTRDAGTTTEVQITGRDGIPTNTPAATLNITATDTRGPGFLTIYPCGSARPNASNLNYATGTTIANTTIAKLSPTGTICVFTYATTHLIVDVNGYYDPTTTYVPLAPARLLDSRPDGTTIDGALQDLGTRDAGTTTEVQITGRDGIPTNTPAATLNITATDTRGPGFLTIYPCGSARPNASNLNYATGTTIANTTIAKLSPTGTICVFTYATTHLIVDVNGYTG